MSSAGGRSVTPAHPIPPARSPAPQERSMPNFRRGPRPHKFLVRGAVLAVLGLLGSPATAPAQTTHIIEVSNNFFGRGGSPFDPTITVGDTVRWEWVSGFHSTTRV